MNKFLNNQNQNGAVLITFALLLTVFLGFVALAMEAGRWYLVRAELSKGVDAAALAGAKNIGNTPPLGTPEEIAEDTGLENFSSTGYLGTEPGSVSFDVTTTVGYGNRTVRVDGEVNALAFLARLFGMNTIDVRASGTARFNEVEIMMVLDNSGGMAGIKMVHLKEAARSFVDFFRETEYYDKMGLITFNTGVQRKVYPVKSVFSFDMQSAITGMSTPTGEAVYNNLEDALAQAVTGFTDERIRKYVVFFTDGKATAFRGKFTRNGKDYDAVVACRSNLLICDGTSRGSILTRLCDPTTGKYISDMGAQVAVFGTGDGQPVATSICGVLNTKWDVFSSYRVPKPGGGYYGEEECNIPENDLRSPNSCGPNWFRDTAKKKALDNADVVKNRNIKIFVIGLGDPGDACNPTPPEIPYLCNPTLDKKFLQQIASRPDYVYDTPNSEQLRGLFIKVAKEIRLQLLR